MPKDIRWEDLPKNLKETLMFHWFAFYSTGNYTEDELNRYEQLVMNDVDRVFDLVCTFVLTVGSISPIPLIECMKAKREKELLENALDSSLFKGDRKRIYELNRVAVLYEIFETYVVSATLFNEFFNDDDDDDNIRRRTK